MKGKGMWDKGEGMMWDKGVNVISTKGVMVNKKPG